MAWSRAVIADKASSDRGGVMRRNISPWGINSVLRGMIATMAVTPTYSWPAPNLSDAANGPQNILDAITAIENTTKDTTLTTYTPVWSSDGTVQPSTNGTKQGVYRVDHGRCSVVVTLTGGSSVAGGTGNLYLTLPIAPKASIQWQYMPAWFWCPAAGSGIFQGLGRAYGGNTTMSIYLPASSSDTRLSQWRNATEGNGAGTGIPLVPSWYGMVTGSELVVSGSYFV